jgi:hypothetical protein
MSIWSVSYAINFRVGEGLDLNSLTLYLGTGLYCGNKYYTDQTEVGENLLSKALAISCFPAAQTTSFRI